MGALMINVKDNVLYMKNRFTFMNEIKTLRVHKLLCIYAELSILLLVKLVIIPAPCRTQQIVERQGDKCLNSILFQRT